MAGEYHVCALLDSKERCMSPVKDAIFRDRESIARQMAPTLSHIEERLNIIMMLTLSISFKHKHQIISTALPIRRPNASVY